MTELFQHQKEGIDFLKKTGRAIIADEMGLGKTRQAVIAASETAGTGSILVVCPASLKINWQREIKAVYPADSIITIRTGKDEILETRWIIVNYDLLPKHLEKVLELIEEGVIKVGIADEAHYIKGKTTIRAKATLEVLTKVESVYLLTGTPVMNRPIELFNMLTAVRHPLSKSRTLYGKKYCGAQLKCLVRDIVANKRFFVDPRNSYPFRTKPDRYKVMIFNDEGGATHLDDLRREISPIFLRRTKKEVLDLPEKIISVEVCEIDDKWRRVYDTAWDSYVDWIENNPSESRNVDNILSAQALVEIMKLKQVCAQSKVDRIVEDIQNAIEQEQKVIVFTQFTEMVQLISSGVGKGCVTLTGADDMNERQKAVDAFQTDDDTKVIICNIKAGGVGINLTAASIVMFADMDWSPEVHAQAEDRAHRIGQEGTVSVYYYVVKDTIEEDIVAVLGQKRGIINQITGEKGGVSLAGELLARITDRVGTTH